MIHPQCWPRAPTSKIRPWYTVCDCSASVFIIIFSHSEKSNFIFVFNTNNITFVCTKFIGVEAVRNIQPFRLLKLQLCDFCFTT